MSEHLLLFSAVYIAWQLKVISRSERQMSGYVGEWDAVG